MYVLVVNLYVLLGNIVGCILHSLFGVLADSKNYFHQRFCSSVLFHFENNNNGSSSCTRCVRSFLRCANQIFWHLIVWQLKLSLNYIIHIICVKCSVILFLPSSKVGFCADAVIFSSSLAMMWRYILYAHKHTLKWNYLVCCLNKIVDWNDCSHLCWMESCFFFFGRIFTLSSYSFQGFECAEKFLFFLQFFVVVFDQCNVYRCILEWFLEKQFYEMLIFVAMNFRRYIFSCENVSPDIKQ